MSALKQRINTIPPSYAAYIYAVIFVIAFLLATPAMADEKAVILRTYYTYPPFIVSLNRGLTYDLIELMNKSAQGEFSFQLEVMPRKRIDMNLQTNTPSIVLFVNPLWMQDSEKTKYTWSSPLFSDKNGIISNVSTKVNYAGPSSVRNLKLGGVFGRKYPGLEESIKRGWVIREDTANERLNVLKLSERRIDFMTAPESVLRYLVKDLGVSDRVYFSPTPLFEYTRHILINNVPPELVDFLMKFTEELPTNQDWLAIKKKYELN